MSSYDNLDWWTCFMYAEQNLAYWMAFMSTKDNLGKWTGFVSTKENISLIAEIWKPHQKSKLLKKFKSYV